jgi:AcrR family transcriptional regulator
MKNAKQRIRQQVLESLKTTDIHNIQVKAITDAIGISRSTFYIYYDSAYSVLQDIEDEYFDGLQAANATFWYYPLKKEYMSEPHPILLNVLQYLKANREISTTLRGPYGEVMFQLRCRKVLQQSLCPEALMKAYYPEDTDLHISYIMGGHIEVLHTWLNSDCPTPAEEIAVKLYRLMFGDLFPKHE